MIAMDDELLTVEEVARLLKMHPDYVRKLLRDGKIPGEKVTGPGGRWRVRRSNVEKLTGGQQGTSSIQES